MKTDFSRHTNQGEQPNNEVPDIVNTQSTVDKPSNLIYSSLNIFVYESNPFA